MTRPTAEETWTMIGKWFDDVGVAIERNGLDGLQEAEDEATGARVMVDIKAGTSPGPEATWARLRAEFVA